MGEHDNRGGGRSGGGRGPRQRSVTAPSERTRRAEPTRFAAYTLLRAVDDGSYANLEMPAILRRHRLEGRDAAFATELRLRHHPVAGLLRRRHRRGGGPPDRAHRPAGARRAAPRGAPAARDARRDPRRRRPDRGPGQGRRRGRRQRVRQRRDAAHQRALAGGVARSRGARGRGCRGARGAAQPPAVGRHRAAGRPARPRPRHVGHGRRRARRPAHRRQRASARARRRPPGPDHRRRAVPLRRRRAQPHLADRHRARLRRPGPDPRGA